MKQICAASCLAALTACAGTAPGPGSGGQTVPTTLALIPSAADNAAFGILLNNVRIASGATATTFDARLASAAQHHADDMVANGFFSHTGSNGSTVGDRATASGYAWTLIGENIAQGQQSEAAAMTAWTNSPGHHANNINPGFNDFGLAKAGAGGNLTWVLVLGSE